jgi:hypothetical protein
MVFKRLLQLLVQRRVVVPHNLEGPCPALRFRATCAHDAESGESAVSISMLLGLLDTYLVRIKHVFPLKPVKKGVTVDLDKV